MKGWKEGVAKASALLTSLISSPPRVSGEAARNEGESRSSEENYQSLLLFTIKFA